ncbi:RDD family protein [bacterium]|nr:RDD family protein [bacterium]
MKASVLRRFGANLVDMVLVGIAAVFWIWFALEISQVTWSEYTQSLEYLDSLRSAGEVELYSVAAIAQVSNLIDAGFYLICGLYYLSEVFGAASPGKLLFGIRIGSRQGTEADVRSKSLRYLIINIPVFVIVFIRLLMLLSFSDYQTFIILALLFSFVSIVIAVYYLVIVLGTLTIFGPEKLCLHDKLSDTAVYLVSEWNPDAVNIAEESASGGHDETHEPPPRNPDAINKVLFK